MRGSYATLSGDVGFYDPLLETEQEADRLLRESFAGKRNDCLSVQKRRTLHRIELDGLAIDSVDWRSEEQEPCLREFFGKLRRDDVEDGTKQDFWDTLDIAFKWKGITPEERAIWVLFYGYEFTPGEVCSIFGVGTTKVWKIRKKVTQALREYFEEESGEDG